MTLDWTTLYIIVIIIITYTTLNAQKTVLGQTEYFLDL